MTSQADPAESPAPAPDAIVVAPERRRHAPVIVSAVVHLVLLAIVLYEQASTFDAPPEQEVPVEVIVEPPPQQPPPPEPEPQPEPEPEKEQPKPKEKPPQQKLVLDEKPAYDAPRAANQEPLEREAPDQETKAQRQAPANAARAAKPSPEAAADPQRQKEATAELAPERPKAEEDKKDAEVLEEAKLEPQAQPEETRGQVEIKASPEPKPKSIAEQLASLEPLPEFKFGGKSKPSPVSGGTANPGYLTVLYGIIMPHMRTPPSLRGKPTPNHGVVVFYVDGDGHLVHQAVARSSGFSELDAAAVAAVRRGAPFPAPPGGRSIGIQFHFGH
jgi:TonB family protein